MSQRWISPEMEYRMVQESPELIGTLQPTGDPDNPIGILVIMYLPEDEDDKREPIRLILKFPLKCLETLEGCKLVKSSLMVQGYPPKLINTFLKGLVELAHYAEFSRPLT